MGRGGRARRRKDESERGDGERGESGGESGVASFIMSVDKRRSAICNGLIREQIAEACVNIS